jgi:glycine/serine hydroxymethyltransferase
MLAQSSQLTNKYAEGCPAALKRYYGGLQPLPEEKLILDKLRQLGILKD